MTLESAIENLQKENAELRTDIVHVRKLLRKKNKLLEELLNITKKRQVGPGTWQMLQQKQEEAVTKRKYFPLQTQEELDEFENRLALDAGLRDDILKELRNCLKTLELKRRFHRIINPKLLTFYNMKGTCNLRRFLDYPNFLDILFKAVEEKGISQEEFMNQVRKALTITKLKVRDPDLLSN